MYACVFACLRYRVIVYTGVDCSFTLLFYCTFAYPLALPFAESHTYVRLRVFVYLRTRWFDCLFDYVFPYFRSHVFASFCVCFIYALFVDLITCACVYLPARLLTWVFVFLFTCVRSCRFAYVRTRLLHTCVRVPLLGCVCVIILVMYAFVFLCICLFVCVFACLCVCLPVCTIVRLCICLRVRFVCCVYVNTFICLRAYMFSCV